MKKKALLCFIVCWMMIWGFSCRDVKEEVDKIGNDIVIAPKDSANLLKLQTDLQTMRRSVEIFHAAQGRYPESLDELAQKGVIAKIPREPMGGEWNYDPSKGTITTSSNPDL